jgi:hypothetical protein
VVHHEHVYVYVVGARAPHLDLGCNGDRATSATWGTRGAT